jgi:hypothetical protein
MHCTVLNIQIIFVFKTVFKRTDKKEMSDEINNTVTSFEKQYLNT